MFLSTLCPTISSTFSTAFESFWASSDGNSRSLTATADQQQLRCHPVSVSQQVKRTRCGTIINSTNTRQQSITLAAPPAPCDGRCSSSASISHEQQHCHYCIDLSREVRRRSIILSTDSQNFVNGDGVHCRIAINTRAGHEGASSSSSVQATPSVSSSSSSSVYVGRNYGYQRVNQQQSASTTSSTTTTTATTSTSAVYRFYCGRNVGRRNYHNQCSRCDGHCGPANSCQCRACYALEQQYNDARARLSQAELSNVDNSLDASSSANTPLISPTIAMPQEQSVNEDESLRTEINDLIRKTMESLAMMQSFPDSPEKDTIVKQLNLIVEAKQEELRKVESNLCVACQNSQKCVALVPCGHVCLCVGCAHHIGMTTRKCPLCTKKMESQLRVFL